jgi:hypothetical protein
MELQWIVKESGGCGGCMSRHARSGRGSHCDSGTSTRRQWRGKSAIAELRGVGRQSRGPAFVRVVSLCFVSWLFASQDGDKRGEGNGARSATRLCAAELVGAKEICSWIRDARLSRDSQGYRRLSGRILRLESPPEDTGGIG